MRTTSAVATKVKLGKITSSPGFIPAPAIDQCKANVPMFTATALFALRQNNLKLLSSLG